MKHVQLELTPDEARHTLQTLHQITALIGAVLGDGSTERHQAIRRVCAKLKQAHLRFDHVSGMAPLEEGAEFMAEVRDQEPTVLERVQTAMGRSGLTADDTVHEVRCLQDGLCEILGGPARMEFDHALHMVRRLGAEKAEWKEGIPADEGVYWVQTLQHDGGDHLILGPTVLCQLELGGGEPELLVVLDPEKDLAWATDLLRCSRGRRGPWSHYYHWTQPVDAPAALLKLADGRIESLT